MFLVEGVARTELLPLRCPEELTGDLQPLVDGRLSQPLVKQKQFELIGIPFRDVRKNLPRTEVGDKVPLRVTPDDLGVGLHVSPHLDVVGEKGTERCRFGAFTRWDQTESGQPFREIVTAPPSPIRRFAAPKCLAGFRLLQHRKRLRPDRRGPTVHHCMRRSGSGQGGTRDGRAAEGGGLTACVSDYLLNDEARRCIIRQCHSPENVES